MQKPRILMLGWEFPPEISGGLGVANYNLCKALAPLSHLTIILPKVDPALKIPNVNIVDLSQIKLHDILDKEEIKEFEQVIREKRIEFNISPYPLRQRTTSEHKSKVSKTIKSRHVAQIHNQFSSSDLYGMDVINKVEYYAEIVVRVASTLSFDIIHAHDWMTCLAGMNLKEKYNKPFVLHIHSLNYDRIGPDKVDWIYNIEKKALGQADIIIPVSQYTGKIINEFYKISKKKIFPVHNGIAAVKAYRSAKNCPATSLN